MVELYGLVICRYMLYSIVDMCRIVSHTDLKIKDYILYIQTIDTSITLFRRTLLACFLSCYLLHMSQLQWKKIYT